MRPTLTRSVPCRGDGRARETRTAAKAHARRGAWKSRRRTHPTLGEGCLLVVWVRSAKPRWAQLAGWPSRRETGADGRRHGPPRRRRPGAAHGAQPLAPAVAVVRIG